MKTNSSNRPRRSKLSIIGLASLAVVTVLLTFSTAAVAYVAWRVGQIDRLEVASSLTDAPADPITAKEVVGTNNAGASDGNSANRDANGPGANSPGTNNQGTNRQVVPEALSETAENYLLVGTDSIEGFDQDDPVALLRSANSHLADAIMVLRLRPDGTSALLSIPRDLLVTIAGTNQVGKINSAYNIDPTPDERAARLIDTIENELDIALQHYVEVDLDGFRQLINAVGGVDIYFEKPLRNRPAGNYDDPAPDSSEFTIEAGWQLLDGEQALAYVRSRNLYEQNADGSWQKKGVWNDLERNDRQREFLIDAIEQVANKFSASPGDLQAGLLVAANAVATSDTLNVVSDGLRLAGQINDFDFDTDIEQYELSVKDVVEPGRWSLELRDEEHNQRVLDVFRGIGFDDVVESRVSVSVSGDERLRLTAELAEVGFMASAGAAGAGAAGAGAGAAGAGAGAAGQTMLTYGPDGRLAAALLLSHLNEDVMLVGDPSLPPNTLALHVVATDVVPVVSDNYRIVDLPPAP